MLSVIGGISYLIYTNTLFTFLERWDYVIGVSGFVVGLFLLWDKYVGILERIRNKVLKWFGVNCQFVLTLIFDSNLDLNSIKKFVIDGFKSKYQCEVKIYPVKKNSCEISINNEFNITIWENVNNEIVITTSKYKTMIKTLSIDVKKIISTLNDIQKQFAEEEKGTGKYFKEKEIDFELYLPYQPKFFRFYSYKNIEIKDYEMKILHNDYNTKIKLKLSSINLNGADSQEIIDLIEKVI